MGVVRKILIFVVLTAGIIAVGRLLPRILPKRSPAVPATNTGLTPDGLKDSTNALPEVEADTTGGRWHDKLFEPLQRAYDLKAKGIRQKKGFWEVVFPKGKPIHEYALGIENICHAQGIVVEQGVELRPSNRSVEYLLQSNGQHIKLRASLGNAFMAGSAKLAIVFTELDSLRETGLAALETAAWDKSLVVNPYSPNAVLKKLRYTQPRNELLIELPLEPSAYPFVDPGKHALFIHHSKEDVAKILDEDLDSVKRAAGFVSRYGDRAIENQPLLEKFFQYAARKNLVFLDLTASPRSLARQTAAAQSARSRGASAYKDSVHIEEELARKAAMAQKTGEAVLVLPYTATAFRNLEKSLAANTVRFNEMGLELVTYSALVSTPDSAPTGATPDPKAMEAQKPHASAGKAPSAAKPGTASVKAGAKPAKPNAKAAGGATAAAKPGSNAANPAGPGPKPAAKSAAPGKTPLAAKPSAKAPPAPKTGVKAGEKSPGKSAKAAVPAKPAAPAKPGAAADAKHPDSGKTPVP